MRKQATQQKDSEGLPQLLEAMGAAVAELRSRPAKAVQVFHHNDADGLCSGAILSSALAAEGYAVQRYCLEKPYPQVLERIYRQEGKIIVFADFAGRIAPMLADLNRGRNLTLILDHHAAEPVADPNVLNLDPDLFGLKGDRDISASTTCYLFAATLNAENRKLAHLAALGAVGDKFFVGGRLVSQNREAAQEAAEQGMLRISREEAGERYFLSSFGREQACDVLGDYLEILGAAGYYQDGPEQGIRVCLEGVSKPSDQLLERLKAIQQKAFAREIVKIRSGALRNSPSIQWFQVEDRFSPMGVKMIGVFCETVKDTADLDPNKYVAGFQWISDEIPGFGRFEFNQTKVSMRVSAQMEQQIRAGKAMGLDVLLPEATRRVGGFSDACHSLTAATTVPKGKETELIEEMENILRKQ